MLSLIWSDAGWAEAFFLAAAIIATLSVIAILVRDVVTVGGVAVVAVLALISWGLFAA